MVQWLVNYFHLTVHDARSTYGHALPEVRAVAHQLVAQWVADYFHFADAVTNVFRRSDKNVHSRTGQWLGRPTHLSSIDQTTSRRYPIDQCPVCLSQPPNCFLTKCHHEFCRVCIDRWLCDQNQCCCPVCRQKL